MAKKEYYLDIGLQNNALTDFVVDPLAADPATGKKEGRLIYNKTTKGLKFYDGSIWRFVGADNLNDLSDTDFTGWLGNTSGQYLVYNASTKKWQPKDFNQKLEHLSNVSLGSVSGQVLGFDGTDWTGVDPSGGIGINTPATGRLVLSGASAATNLIASPELTYTENISTAFDGLTVYNKSKDIPILRTARKVNPSTGNFLGVIGATNAEAHPQGIAAGIVMVASENHTATAQGTIVRFMSTKTGQSALSTPLQISGSGNVIISSTGTTEDYPNTALHVNGGSAHPIVFVSNPYVIDSGTTNDRYIVFNQTSTLAKTVTFPNPGPTYKGRIITVRLIKDVSTYPDLDLVTVSGAANGFYTTRSSNAQTITTSGQWREFGCAQANGNWTWLQLSTNGTD